MESDHGRPSGARDAPLIFRIVDFASAPLGPWVLEAIRLTGFIAFPPLPPPSLGVGGRVTPFAPSCSYPEDWKRGFVSLNAKCHIGTDLVGNFSSTRFGVWRLVVLWGYGVGGQVDCG